MREERAHCTNAFKMPSSCMSFRMATRTRRILAASLSLPDDERYRRASGMTRIVSPGVFRGHDSPGIVGSTISSVSSDEMDARSNGASSNCESHRRTIYLSSHSHESPVSGLADCPSSCSLPFSIADSSSSRCLVSVLKNLTITFSPLTLQNVYRSLHIALESGISSWVFVSGSFEGGDRRYARRASAKAGTNLSRWGSRS